MVNMSSCGTVLQLFPCLICVSPCLLSCIWREAKVFICGFESGLQNFSQCMTSNVGACMLAKNKLVQ